MAKEIIKIELNEKDILELVVKTYGLDPEKAKISISHIQGDRPGERTYTTITVEAEKYKVKHT